MRARTDLNKLLNAYHRRLDRLRVLIWLLQRYPLGGEAERLACYMVVDLRNCWVEFSRHFFLSCFIRARSSEGRRISHERGDLRTLEDAIDAASRLMAPQRKLPSRVRRRDEPDWGSPHTIITLAKRFRFSNLPEIGSAFSVGTRVFNDLPVIRNFYAHRNRFTYRAATSLARLYGLPGSLTPTELLCSHGRGRPQSVVQDWLDDLYLIGEFLCSHR